MNSILIVVNPNSGEKQAAEYGEALVDIFDAKGIHNELYVTSSEQDHKEIGEILKKDKFESVAVLGGDGTISRFVNAIAELKKRPEILLLPFGTTNNLARALEMDMNVDTLIEKIENKQLTKKSIDIGKLNDHYFISTVSVGSIPEIAWKVDEDSKEKLGPFAYVKEGLKVLNKDETFSVTIKTDEEKIQHDEIQLVVIGLTNSVFGIPTFFNDGAIDDGYLYLFGLKSSDLVEEISTLANFALWNEEKSEGDDISFSSKFSRAEIESTTQMHLAVDGEKGPQFPITLEILHKHLTFIVPEKD